MALSFEAWLTSAGYSKDWYDKLDVMHQMQAEQAYRDSEDDQGYVQSLSPKAKTELGRIAAGKAASNPTPPTKAQAAAQKQQSLADQQKSAIAQATGQQPAADSGLAEILRALPPDQAQALQTTGALKDPAKAQLFIQSWQAQQSSIYNLPMGWANQQVMLSNPQPAPLTGSEAKKKLLANVNAEGQAEGPQWTSAINAMFAPGLWNDPTRVKDLQDQLVKAGYADPTSLAHPGAYDEQTRRAYVNVIQDAIAEHKTIDQVLADGAIDFQKKQAQAKSDFLSARSSVKNPFVAPALTTDDPAKVMQVVSDHFQQTVGRKPSTAELKALTATYRSFEQKQNAAATEAARYQNEATNAGNTYQFDLAHQAEEHKYGITPSKAPNMPAPPTIQTFDPEAEAAAQGRALAPNEAGGEDLRNAFQGFIQAIQAP